MESYSAREILETNRMIDEQGLDVRTITMGINLLDCASRDIDHLKSNIQQKILFLAENLDSTAKSIEEDYGIPIINRRITITPISFLVGGLPHINEIPIEKIVQFHDSTHKDSCPECVSSEINNDLVEIARTLDEVAKKVKVDFLGGFSALVHKGFSRADLSVIHSLPEILSKTERVCSSVNVATTKSGMNMNAVAMMGHIISKIAELTAENNSIGCAKLVVFANAVEDNPFMAGGFHGNAESECCINVGVSGPGVVRNTIKHHPNADFETMADLIKKTAFKITRMGQLVAQEAAKRLNVPFGIVDVSLAPTTRPNDSVAGILEEMGLISVGAPGTTAALALLTDAVKKGGLMASSYVGGLSGAFIPVSEDKNMNEAAQNGNLTLEKLEAMTAVCSTGLDMICLPGSTSAYTLSGIIADEASIGMMNNKTVGCRLIPVVGKEVGENVEFGGLLGNAVVMKVNNTSCQGFIERLGRFPAPVHSFKN